MFLNSMTTAPTQTTPGLNVEERRAMLQQKLDDIFLSKDKSGILALDLEMNLLICSAQSYKHESVLKPFPSTFLSDSNNDKNFAQLLTALMSLPPVLDWRSKLKSFDDQQLAVLHWLFTHKNYQLELATSIDQNKLKEMSKCIENFTKPTYVFEVKYSEAKNSKFESLIEATKSRLETTEPVTSINFHGTRMDNMYPIMHMGLLAHLNKTSLYGEGTYLSQEATVSLHFSPSCKSWTNSLIGQRMSGMLVCETINDPIHVKTGLNETSNSSASQTTAAGNAAAQERTPTVKKSDVPDKYFVVKNNEYVRVRYIVLYAERYKVKKTNKLVHLLNENRFALFLIAYSLLLVFIGLMNSRAFHKYIKMSYRKLSNFFLGDASSYD